MSRQQRANTHLDLKFTVGDDNDDFENQDSSINKTNRPLSQRIVLDDTMEVNSVSNRD